MKLNNNRDEHDHSQENSIMKRIAEKVKQYWNNMYCSNKCKTMSRGSYNIVRAMGWSRGENWRRNHPKSLNKQHKN